MVPAHLFLGGETIGELFEHQVRPGMIPLTNTTSIHFIIRARAVAR
jgi:hypothetical protein